MLQKPKTVVVEDDHDLLFLYSHKLELEGFEVWTATNGEDALTLVKKHRPDIILLDLLLPGMSGADVLASIRSNQWGSDTRVIVLTNVSRDEASPVLRVLGVDRFLVKAHHTPTQIVQTVRDVLGIRANK